MLSHNIAAKSQEERDKVNVDLAASGVVYPYAPPMLKL